MGQLDHIDQMIRLSAITISGFMNTQSGIISQMITISYYVVGLEYLGLCPSDNIIDINYTTRYNLGI